MTFYAMAQNPFPFLFSLYIVRNISKLHYYVHLFLWLTVKPNWTLKMTIERVSVNIKFLRQLRQKRLNAMDQTHTTTALKERKRRWHLRAVDRGAIQVLKQ